MKGSLFSIHGVVVHGFSAIAVLFMTLPIHGIAAEEQLDRKAEVRWAKGILETFVQGVFSADEATFGLLSPELEKAYPDPARLYRQFYGYASFKISSYKVAPNKCEVIFQGELGPAWRGRKAANLTAHVAKESAGRWSIRLIIIREKKGKLGIEKGKK